MSEKIKLKELLSERTFRTIGGFVSQKPFSKPEVVKEEGESKYKKFFRSAMEKFGIDEPDQFKDKDKAKEFWNYVDANWEAEQETDIDEEKLRELIRSML